MSRRAPRGRPAREQGTVYQLHFTPPLGHAKHYAGWAKDVDERLAEHAAGRGARITQVQVERGGTWRVARTVPGTRDDEARLKERGQSRNCPVCIAERAEKTGETDTRQAPRAAGRDRVKGRAASREPEPAKPIQQWWPEPAKVTPEIDAVVDGLIAKWTARPKEPAAEYEMEAG